MDTWDFSKASSVCTGAGILLPSWGLPSELQEVRALQEEAGLEDDACRRMSMCRVVLLMLRLTRVASFPVAVEWVTILEAWFANVAKNAKKVSSSASLHPCYVSGNLLCREVDDG